MKNYSKKLSLLIPVIGLTLTLSYAQNPARDLQDIVGERGSYAEMDLEKRGYVHIKTTKYGYDVYSSWWSPSKSKCVTYHLTDGNVRSVVDVPPFDCNKGTGAGYSNQSYSHNSYHHDNSSHYSNRDHDEAFERGHTDGLHNKAYHNIYADANLKNAYSDGYQSGVNQRGYNTSHHSGRGGYQAHARVDDIVGMTVEKTIEVLSSRGFSLVDTFKHDGKTHRIFYNRQTGQCVDTIGLHGTTRRADNSTRCNS